MEKSDSTQESFTQRTEEEGFLESFDPELRRAYEFADQKVDPDLVDKSKIKMYKDKIKISGDGTFYTLQGEGPTIGLPAVFLRLHVCNLRCVWCDAWYTWNPNTTEYWTEPRDVSFEECAKLVEKTWVEGVHGPPMNQRRLVITGGEPLLQSKQLQILDEEFLNHSSQADPWAIEVETNGTRMPTEQQLREWQFNCSPKTSNSENKDYAMFKPKVLDALNQVNTTFKFVCMTEEDLDEIDETYGGYVNWTKVIIMPQGVTEEEVSINAKRLAEPCKERGLRLLPRLQNICWDGARRGV